MSTRVQPDRLMRELDKLASFTDCPQGTNPALPEPQRPVTRIVFTQRDLEARAWFKHVAREAGFTVREDAVGNTFVRWQGAEPSLPAVGTGSHIDAIPYAGMYDGTVGVLGGLEAMRSLRESGFHPRRSIELLLFTSEEPTRFGLGCLGSRLLSGQLAPEVADTLPDRLQEIEPEAVPGRTLRAVRHAAGFEGDLHEVVLPAEAYAAWVELHIEQGPLLEQHGEDLGVVTHIAGPASYRFVVTGVGGHAGALLMPDRRDALCAASEIILAVETAVTGANIASRTTDTVATVGKLEVHPGAVNAVPSRVALLLDLRDIDTERREAVMGEIRQRVRQIAARRGVQVDEQAINADGAVACDPELIALAERTADTMGLRQRRMVSRAYHDTTFMARLAPVVMLFVPCRGGVSHRPDEYASPAAIGKGVALLAALLSTLAGSAADAS